MAGVNRYGKDDEAGRRTFSGGDGPFCCLYTATSYEALLSLAITCGTIAYHVVMRLLVGLVFQTALRNRADLGKRWYRVSRREMTVYERLDVKGWKRGMPTYDSTLFDPRIHTCMVRDRAGHV